MKQGRGQGMRRAREVKVVRWRVVVWVAGQLNRVAQVVVMVNGGGAWLWWCDRSKGRREQGSAECVRWRNRGANKGWLRWW